MMMPAVLHICLSSRYTSALKSRHVTLDAVETRQQCFSLVTFEASHHSTATCWYLSFASACPQRAAQPEDRQTTKPRAEPVLFH